MRYLVAVTDAGTRRWASGLAAACALAGWGCGTTTDQNDEATTHRPTIAAAVINLGKTLRVGWFGMDGHVGEGPGGNTTNPIYKVVGWNPHAEGTADIPGVIALADQKDILLIAMTAGGPNNYGAKTPAGFDLNAYIAQLAKLAAIPAFNDAVARGRIQCYVADEPNRTDLWNNSSGQSTFTPALVNRVAQENKRKWPNCLTYIRATPELLNSGWGGNPKPTGGYTHLDYGWLQYNSTTRKTFSTIKAAIDFQKGIATQLNIGLALSMNMVNAGLRTNLDGVTACWDADRNSATATAVVIGNPAGANPAGGTYSEGQQVPCSQLPPNSQNLMVNPNWIKRIADVGKADLDVPFLLYWSYPSASAGSDLLQPYVFRSDFVSAFDYAINQGATRTSFHGYRTPKP